MVLKKIESFGNDKTAYLPRGWSTVKCKVCNEDELGIIVINEVLGFLYQRPDTVPLGDGVSPPINGNACLVADLDWHDHV